MTVGVPTGLRQWGRCRCGLTSTRNAASPTSDCVGWPAAGATHETPWRDRTARREAAPLVPEGVAVPLRRRVRRVADLRHLRATAVVDTHGGCGTRRDRRTARGRRALRGRPQGLPAGAREPRVRGAREAG